MAEGMKSSPIGLAKCAIEDMCDRISSMLVEKNQSYGNSALDPIRIFSKAAADEQLLVRIDDKLSRLAKGKELGEDTILDLTGYLVLLLISRETAKPTTGD